MFPNTYSSRPRRTLVGFAIHNARYTTGNRENYQSCLSSQVLLLLERPVQTCCPLCGDLDSISFCSSSNLRQSISRAKQGHGGVRSGASPYHFKRRLQELLTQIHTPYTNNCTNRLENVRTASRGYVHAQNQISGVSTWMGTLIINLPRFVYFMYLPERIGVCVV